MEREMLLSAGGWKHGRRPNMFWPVGISKRFVAPQVSIVWPDKHTSVFDSEWLKKHCFSDAARQALREELFLNGESSFFIFYMYMVKGYQKFVCLSTHTQSDFAVSKL